LDVLQDIVLPLLRNPLVGPQTPFDLFEKMLSVDAPALLGTNGGVDRDVVTVDAAVDCRAANFRVRVLPSRSSLPALLDEVDRTTEGAG
jgi:hypothetical protein